jgi:hypothetical protein
LIGKWDEPWSRLEMTEPKPDYNVTMDVIIVTDSWEARLLQKARQMRSEWLQNKRRLLLLIGDDGSMLMFCTTPAGRIEIG